MCTLERNIAVDFTFSLHKSNQRPHTPILKINKHKENILCRRRDIKKYTVTKKPKRRI